MRSMTASAESAGFCCPEDLDGHRDHDHRVDEVQQIQRIVGHVIERELVAVVDRFFEPRRERVVERAHLRHRWWPSACSTASVRLPGTTSRRTARVRRRHWAAGSSGMLTPPPGGARARYSSTQSTTTLCRCRTRISWSLSGKSSTTPVSSAACVPPSMPASCSANSLSTTEATSCSMRSRTVRRGMECVVRLELVGVVRRRPVAVQQVPAAVDQDLQVREDLEVGDAPRLDAAGVQSGRLVRLRCPPRPDQAAARRPFDRVHELGCQQPPPGSRGGHQPVRTVDLEVRALERGVGLTDLDRHLLRSAATARGSTPGRRRRRSSSCCCCERRNRNARSSFRTGSRPAR